MPTLTVTLTVHPDLPQAERARLTRIVAKAADMHALLTRMVEATAVNEWPEDIVEDARALLAIVDSPDSTTIQ